MHTTKKRDCEEIVPEGIYGCYGNWTSPGIKQGEVLCGHGYSLCSSKSSVKQLGLTKEKCKNISNPNVFFASLVSGWPCNQTSFANSTDLLWGCAKDSASLVCNPFNSGCRGFYVCEHNWSYFYLHIRELQMLELSNVYSLNNIMFLCLFKKKCNRKNDSKKKIKKKCKVLCYTSANSSNYFFCCSFLIYYILKKKKSNIELIQQKFGHAHVHVSMQHEDLSSTQDASNDAAKKKGKSMSLVFLIILAIGVTVACNVCSFALYYCYRRQLTSRKTMTSMTNVLATSSRSVIGDPNYKKHSTNVSNSNIDHDRRTSQHNRDPSNKVPTDIQLISAQTDGTTTNGNTENNTEDNTENNNSNNNNNNQVVNLSAEGKIEPLPNQGKEGEGELLQNEILAQDGFDTGSTQSQNNTDQVPAEINNIYFFLVVFVITVFFFLVSSSFTHVSCSFSNFEIRGPTAKKEKSFHKDSFWRLKFKKKFIIEIQLFDNVEKVICLKKTDYQELISL
ncbi:hypothetical protein RFI_23403 [Reticulomyxa filosa]|uniref:Uncharacterized protein n=1 Tax=Reticulomyxa filosa TaxID=46433 RepID=X6MJZ4_RETFI|nr:hypothetical protein RFI_23403 [Reticulomyxa filosa]|eukprot:ETO13966.1 hypothetical protein RFI_23403 [Reticulomyxa filosa]